MTVYYVGPGGSDASDGLSWANRKLTSNGAEAVATTAGDIVYFGPGIYWGTNNYTTLTASGSSGSPITWIADVTGINTDGIGGQILFHGGSTERPGTLNFNGDYAFTATSISWRTFIGFHFGGANDAYSIDFGTAEGVVIEDCVFQEFHELPADGGGVRIQTVTSQLDIRNCVFGQCGFNGILIGTGTGGSGKTINIENCSFFPGYPGTNNANININNQDNVYIRNCYFSGGLDHAIYYTSSQGGSLLVQGCVITDGANIQNAAGTANEDYNLFWLATKGGTWGGGSNSVTRPPWMAQPILMRHTNEGDDELGYGFVFPWTFGVWASHFPAAWFGLPTGHPSSDMYDFATNPDDKKTLGPITFSQVARNDTDFPVGSVSSIELADHGVDYVTIPVKPGQRTITCKVFRETGYIGTNPQMILHAPGETDVTITDVGSANSWNTIQASITPDTGLRYLTIEFRNNNTKKKARKVRFADIVIT